MHREIDRLYLLHLWKNVEPKVTGPYDDDQQRVRAARRIRQKEGDGLAPTPLFRLTLEDDDHLGIRPVVQSFGGGELESTARKQPRA